MGHPENHVLNLDYGIKEEDILKAICKKADEYRQMLGVSTISGFLKQAIKNDIYDELFLKVKEDPWSTVMMHPQERYAETHFMRSRASEFFINDGPARTGMGFDDFIQQPTYLVEHWLSTFRQVNASTRTEGKRAEEEIRRQNIEFNNTKKR